MKSFSFYRRLSAAAVLVLLFCGLNVIQPTYAQEESIDDSFLDEIIDDPSASPSTTFESEPEPAAAESAPEPVSKPKPSELKGSIDEDVLVNVVFTEKKIKAYGWGEYKVGGRCLCCDNNLDGDCIVVFSTNRSEKQRIKQIVDGDIEADSSDKSSYFGDVEERERPVPVSMLVAEIELKKMQDIYRVIVYTMVNKEKKKNYLSNCELGYYDRFDRLQWVGTKTSKWSDVSITFELTKPIFTKTVLLRVKDGKSRITEVALFGTNDSK